MTKLILLLLVVAAAYLFIRNYRRRVERSERPGAKSPEETMVRCAVCGVHHPRSESLLAGGKFYCSPEHERRVRERQ